MQQETSTSATKPKTTATPGKKRRRRAGVFNLILIIGIIGAVALFFWAEQQRRDALNQLQATEEQLAEIKESTERNGQQVADEVLSRLREHMEIPTEPQPTVATIIDVDRLRETSDFYKSAENGDHLILTEKRAILYDPKSDLIIDVVPVILNPEDQAAQEGTGDDVTDANTQEGAPDAAEPLGDTTQETEAPSPGTQELPAGVTGPPAP